MSEVGRFVDFADLNGYELGLAVAIASQRILDRIKAVEEKVDKLGEKGVFLRSRADEYLDDLWMSKHGPEVPPIGEPKRESDLDHETLRLMEASVIEGASGKDLPGSGEVRNG